MYKALNYWVFGGFGPNKTPYEFIDFAKAQRIKECQVRMVGPEWYGCQ